jgi:NTP pyrophosphatase (non-canonical NTP hydrolase)
MLESKGVRMKQYQEWVDSLTLQEYEKPSTRFSENGKLIHAAFGVSGEAGELLDAVKKCIFYGKELDTANVVEELGDILFYVAMACNALGISLEQVMDSNFKKLSKRYSSGSFSEKEAQERIDKSK